MFLFRVRETSTSSFPAAEKSVRYMHIQTISHINLKCEILNVLMSHRNAKFSGSCLSR